MLRAGRILREKKEITVVASSNTRKEVTGSEVPPGPVQSPQCRVARFLALLE
jgi:hypothetical protein